MNVTKRQAFISTSLVLALVLVMLFSPTYSPVEAALEGLRIDAINWQGTVAPGATDLDLELQLLNLNNITIKGIQGTLLVPFPFTDASDDDTNLTATGISLSSYTNISQYSVLAGDPFQLTYTVDIDSDAVKGSYEANLTVNYLKKFPNGTLGQAQQNFTVNLVVPNQAPSFDLVTPDAGTLDVETGDITTFEVLGYDSDNDTLTYTWELDDVEQTTNTSSVNLRKGNRVLIFTVPETTPATYRLQAIVSDGTASTGEEWELDVANSAPVFDSTTPDAGTVTMDVNETKSFEVLGYDADKDALSYRWELDQTPITTNTSMTVLQNGNRTLIFTTGPESPLTYRLEVFLTAGADTVTQTWQINVPDAAPETTFTISSQYIEAGVENDINITASNTRWTEMVSGEFSAQVQAAFSLTGGSEPAAVITGPTSWEIEDVIPGQVLTFPVTVYVAVDLIGSSTDISFVIDYTDEFNNAYEETFDVSLIIRGRIIMKVFDMNVSASKLYRGDEVSVTATLLNLGTTSAQFLNISLVDATGDLVLLTTSKAYLGELEPDSPLPFSLSAIISSQATIGAKTIHCFITYQDFIYVEHTMELTFKIEIVPGTGSTTGTTNPYNNLFTSLLESSFTLLLIAGTLAAIGFIIVRYRRRAT
ncbi:MAG: hypothetical protein ACFFCZ_24505 [Promethearchaeota archaeon]